MKPDGASLSVIVPALNEEAGLGAVLAAARTAGEGEIEVIVVDGGSRDGTVGVAEACGARVLVGPRGRARQMNAGAEVARGEVLLFLHADTIVPPGYDRAVRAALAEPSIVAGAFRLAITGDGWALRAIERLVGLRSTLGGLPYGDQALFVRAEVFRRLDGYAELPIMEDVDLVRRLRRLGRLRIVAESVLTDGRRWRQRGVWRTTMLNQACLAAYALGIPPSRIARWRRPFTG